MQPIGEVIARLNHSEPKTPSANPQTNSASVSLRNDTEGKQRLTNLISVCFDSLKVYGKEPEQLGNLNKLFHFILSDFPYDKIEAAMKFYMTHNTEMPAPADIVNIIERGNKPPFQKAIYVAICQKSAEDRTSDEWQYKREYEQFQITGKHA